MNRPVHTAHDDKRPSFRRALLGNRYSASTDTVARGRAKAHLSATVRGLVFLGIGYLFGRCSLILGAAPLGLALLSASSAYTWYILGGLILAAITHPVTLSTPWWLVLSVFCVLLRLAVMFFVDPPLLPGEQPARGLRGTWKYARTYLKLCFTSACANMGIGVLRDAPDKEDPTEDYYAGIARRAPDKQSAGSDGSGGREKQSQNAPPGNASHTASAAACRCRPACDARLFREHPFLRVLTAAVTGFAAGIGGMIAGGFHYYDLFSALCMILAVPLATVILIPVFGEAGETLLFSPRPLMSTEGVRTDSGSAPAGWNHLITRFKLLPLLSLLGLVLGVVYAARPFSPMLGTPYLTVRLATLLGLIMTLSASARLGLLPGLAVSVVVGIGTGPTLLPIFVLAAVMYAFLHILSHRAGIIGGCVSGVLWCLTGGDLTVLVTQCPTLLLTIPVYFLIETLWERMPLCPEEKEVRLGDFSLAVAGETRLSDQCARLSSLSEAFSALSHQFYDLSDQLKQPRRPELLRLCEACLSDRCALCKARDACGGADAPPLRSLRAALAAQLEEQGRADEARLPSDLREVCSQLSRVVTDINSRCAQLNQRLIRGEKTEVFAADYAHMAALLSDAAQENGEEYRCNRVAADHIYDFLSALGVEVQGVVVCGKRNCKVIVRGRRMDKLDGQMEQVQSQLEILCAAHFSPPEFETGDSYTVMMLSSLPRMAPVFSGSTVPAGCDSELSAAPLTNESSSVQDPSHADGAYLPPAVCGDHIAIFRNEQACFYALISDGMGSGVEASATSDICAAFLEKMLAAGNRVEISLQMLNSFLRAKNAGSGEECSATVDLMELDMVGGQAVFAKNGAAPTYVVRGGTVYKLRTRSLPLGILRDSAPQLLRFRMHPGDVVVMVSDGVTLGNDECPWLIDLLSDPLPDSMDSLRLDILRRAIASGSPDDLSAIAIRV